jgi:hypothetical protein
MNLAAALTTLALVVVGCASAPPTTEVTLDPIGPHLAGPSRGSQGFLRVHTATTDEQSGKIPYQVHTPYWVYSEGGEKVRSVANHVGITDQSPMTVRLPSGRYRVLARADGLGLVTVPILVSGGMLTEVFLQHRGMDVPTGTSEAELVRLPGGRVAGHRAKDTSRPAR